MPYQNMSLEDFARHVGMDAREVRRLADRGRLPGQKIGGQWRFNRARVTEWLQQEMPALDESRLIALERAMGGVPGSTAGQGNMVVTSLIGLEGMDLTLPARTRASVLHELTRLAERTGLLYDSEGLLKALQEREAMCSTALPNGVAVPHPRQPMPYASAEPLICVGCVPGGIAFGSAAGELTHLFFLICCHEDRHHLQVLARLMRILDTDLVGLLNEAQTPEDLLEVLVARETRVVGQVK